jgi:hypothetical protein
LQISLFAADFDCAIIGTSPFSLFEALYQSRSGKRVVIFEASDTCGGAWKGINICGLMNVDLGCHQIGGDLTLKSFLEEYAGCQIVSLDHPNLPFTPGKGNGWYFSHGCSELIEHLLQLIHATDIVLLTCERVETVFVDTVQKIATLHTGRRSITTEKLIATPMSSFSLNTTAPPNYSKTKYYHLYLLIQDQSAPKFSYHSGIGNGVSRIMNLTPFLQLEGTGRHLVVVQTHGEKHLHDGDAHLSAMKKANLIDESAYILQAETYIYEAGSLNQTQIANLGAKEIIEVMQTGHFQGLSSYIPKWKKVLRPYSDAKN